MISLRARPSYSERDAARELGIGVEQFRTLVRRHILRADETADDIACAYYEASDLLILRMLSAAAADGAN